MTDSLAAALPGAVPAGAGSGAGAAALSAKAPAPDGLFAAALAALRAGATPNNGATPDDGGAAPSLGALTSTPPSLPRGPALPNGSGERRVASRPVGADSAGAPLPGVDPSLAALAVPLPAAAPPAGAPLPGSGTALSAGESSPAPMTPGSPPLGGGFPGPTSEQRLAGPGAAAALGSAAAPPAPGRGSALSSAHGAAAAAPAPLPGTPSAPQSVSPSVVTPLGVPGAVVVRPEVTAPAQSAPAQPSPGLPASAPPGFATQLARPLFTVVAAGPGEHVMTVKVTPENFGPVTVQAHIGAEGVRVELFAPSDAGRAAVQAVLPELRRDLADAGLGASLDLSSRDAPQPEGGPGGFDGRGPGGFDGGGRGGRDGGRGRRGTPALRLGSISAAGLPERGAPLVRSGADTSLDILA